MTPSDNHPEIPSFKKQEDEEKKGSGLPLLGRGGKAALKIRGLGSGTTLMERLRQFKKKDVAFILSGLGVLFLAPLAEHFILGPGDESKMLNRGFDSKGNVFSEANPYEPGTGGFSPGGLPGQGTDVITPLNVRDPSALVMGPGATQTPPAPASAKDDKKEASIWKDAVTEAGRAGARRASESAGLPSPRGSLAGAMRGLASLGGGGGGGPFYSLPPISASNVPNKTGGGRSMMNVAGAPGYKGVAERGMSSGGNEDALKKAGENASSLFNRAGSAAGNLDAAAREAIPVGGGGRGAGEGGPGGGAAGKDPGGNQNKDNKSLGESLAFLRAKMIMEKQLELQWKKKEWREFEFYKTMQADLAKSIITEGTNAMLKPLSGALARWVKKQVGGHPDVQCFNHDAHQYASFAWEDVVNCDTSEHNTYACRVYHHEIPGWECFEGPDKKGDTKGGDGSGEVPTAGLAKNLGANSDANVNAAHKAISDGSTKLFERLDSFLAGCPGGKGEKGKGGVCTETEKNQATQLRALVEKAQKDFGSSFKEAFKLQGEGFRHIITAYEQYRTGMGGAGDVLAVVGTENLEGTVVYWGAQALTNLQNKNNKDAADTASRNLEKAQRRYAEISRKTEGINNMVTGGGDVSLTKAETRQNDAKGKVEEAQNSMKDDYYVKAQEYRGSKLPQGIVDNAVAFFKGISDGLDEAKKRIEDDIVYRTDYAIPIQKKADAVAAVVDKVSQAAYLICQATTNDGGTVLGNQMKAVLTERGVLLQDPAAFAKEIETEKIKAEGKITQK